MKRLLLILSLSAVASLLNGCVGKSDEDWRRTDVPEEKRFPVIVRTSGKLTFQKSKSSVVATINCPERQAMAVTWPDGAPRVEQGEVEILIERWQGGETLPLRVISNGKTVYDATLCGRHHVHMARKTEDGCDGGEYPDSYFKQTRKTLWPNDGKSYLLCGSGIRWTVWRCPTCYEAAERWRKRHGISD